LTAGVEYLLDERSLYLLLIICIYCL